MKDFGEFMAKAYADKVDGPPPGDGLGGITAMIPGATEYFTANLTPGNYVMICFVPDAKDGKPHSDHGMVKEFTVKETEEQSHDAFHARRRGGPAASGCGPAVRSTDDIVH